MPPQYRVAVFSRLRLVVPHLTVLSLAFGALQQHAHAGPVTFRWDYSASGAAGFMLHCGQSSGAYTSHTDVGNTDTYTHTSLPEGATSVCAVTAYDSARVESDYSQAVSVQVPAPPTPTPTVNFTASKTSGAAPLGVRFTSSTTAAVTSWSWNFGDGTSSTAKDPAHTYSTVGSYTVTLTATTSSGTQITKTSATPITVLQPIVANFSASPVSGTAPLSVTFANTTTGTVTTWRWSYGDGATGSGKNPTHVYKTPGTYTVKLTAIGPAGTVYKTRTGLIQVTAQ